MAAFINTNISSLNAQRNLNTSQSSLATSLQRLSSGLRINSAKDDAAGLAISERMSSQIRGADQAARNANDGISLAQTAEGDLAQIGNNLQRIRELAVQASNASNSASDRASLNAEATQLIAEIDRVANSSSFNGIKLLDGSFNAQTFQVGANNTSNDRISIDSIGSAKANSLGVGSGSSYSTKVSGTNVSAGALGAGDLVINGYQVGATSSDGVSNVGGNTSAIAKAAAINAISSKTGVTATVEATTVEGTAATGFATEIEDGDITINGVNIGAIAAAGSAGERGSQVAAAVNAKSSQTGVTATFDSATGKVELNAADGRNITVSRASDSHTGVANTVSGLGSGTTGADAAAATTTSRAQINLSSTSSTGITLANGGTGTVTGNAPTVFADANDIAEGDIVINGVSIGAVTYGAAEDAASAGGLIADAINEKTSETGVTAAADAGTGAITLTANNAGFTIETKGTALATVTGFAVGKTVIGGAGASASGLTAGVNSATATAGAGVSSLDLTTAEGAQAALTTLDSAISSVNSSRAALGAYQNRFASTVASLQTTSENLSASRSRIQDTDFAKETASLTRGQILQQAGTAMLAQANSLPNGVLALLRG